MITGVLGVPGAGKSLYMLWAMGQYVRAGRRVYTNMRLTKECPFYNRVGLLDSDDGSSPVFDHPEVNGKEYKAFWHYIRPGNIDKPGAAIFIDELDNYFDSQDFTKLAGRRDTFMYWKQHRHRGEDVIFTVQNLDNLYNRIRRMTQKWVCCLNEARSSRLKMMIAGPKWCNFIRSEFSSAPFTKKTHTGDGHFSQAEASAMFSWYRSDQWASLISPTENKKVEDDQRGGTGSVISGREEKPVGRRRRASPVRPATPALDQVGGASVPADPWDARD